MLCAVFAQLRSAAPRRVQRDSEKPEKAVKKLATNGALSQRTAWIRNRLSQIFTASWRNSRDCGFWL